MMLPSRVDSFTRTAANGTDFNKNSVTVLRPKGRGMDGLATQAREVGGARHGNVAETTHSAAKMRKTLPWLEARSPNTVLGERTLRDEPRALQQVPEIETVRVTNVERTLSCKSLSDDPSIRPIGSEPTIVNSKIVTLKPKSHSQTSQRPPGIREPALGRRKQHKSDSDSPMFSYASSEYSTTTPSDNGLPMSYPMKDPASYERIVAEVAISQAHTRGPQIAKKAQQDGLGVLSSESANTAAKAGTRSRGTRTLKPNTNPYRDKVNSAIDTDRRRKCRSCESALFEGGLSLSGKYYTSHPSHARPARKPTLHTLPPHLMPSTSSSSRSNELQARYRKGVPVHGRTEALSNVLNEAARAISRTQAAVATPADPLRLSSPSQQGLPSDDSMSHTPPQLYQPTSVESIVKDFAYTPPKSKKRSQRSLDRELYGAAASFYHDHGQSVAAQPGVRHSIAYVQKDLPALPPTAHRRRRSLRDKHERVHHSHGLRLGKHNGVSGSSAGSRRPGRPLRRKKAAETGALRAFNPGAGVRSHKVHEHVEHWQPFRHHRQYSELMKSPYYQDDDALAQQDSDTRYRKCISLRHPRKKHISVKDKDGFQLGKYHKCQPIARDWKLGRKRLTSWIACLNTIFVGLIAGIYAGEVPRIQYQLADESHWVIFGNMLCRKRWLSPALEVLGASLMSDRPHQELVMYDDVRRQGGGIGVWLGIWTFCFSSSLSIGFCLGALVISGLDPSWGFWITIILLVFFLSVNVISPETRRSHHRRSFHHFFDEQEKVRHRVARGEVKLHVFDEGPKWWFEEVWAGLVLVKRMVFQAGFFVMTLYLAWMQAQLTLVILLLGALLSRDYGWPSYSVGLAALAVPVGAGLAMPLTKASWLSRSRVVPARTDSMTVQKRVTWSSHMLRRLVFSLLLPFAGLGYCLAARGPSLHWSAAVIMAGFVGFLTDLGIAECVGLIMETFDTCDLQPGVNTRHRVQSMSASTRMRRTNYSSFPRVCAGWFASQSLGFFLAAGATVVAGRVTNRYGAQTAISIFAAILLAVTLLLLIILWRWKEIQVIPSYTMGTRRGSKDWDPSFGDPEWKAVVIGNASGKFRRVNLLELGAMSRWTEIRKLNNLIRR
ncbi:hypothetical protein AC579_3071 [Pseudocercospora musae]|uniref:Uncharacterized protein n=1 Tax=Pseudocercospora musae TaxID=113226 RepID=A0A139IK00_9PEZI|nr:hypothetical protein AC579_3071 [Pseudocercospora musae]